MAVIRVSGHHGSGKTTLSVRLAKTLEYLYHNTGSIFRQIAKEQGLSIEEYYKKVAADPKLEKEIDGRSAKLMTTQNNVVVEGRMAPFQPSPFPTINILLTVDMAEGARRQILRKENNGLTQERMMKISSERLREETAHYQALYGIQNHLDPKHFDIVIDTSGLGENEVFIAVFEKVCDLLKAKGEPVPAQNS